MRMCIMKIQSVENHQQNYQYKSNLNFKSTVLPKKWALKEVSEQTIKKVSAAISATGIASLMLGQSNDDYVTSIATPIDRLNYSNEDMQALQEGYEYYPILMDTLLSTKDKNNAIRDIHKEEIENLTEIYDRNPDLTEELLTQKTEDGLFRYATQDVIYIAKANELSPELLEVSKKHPGFVNALINTVDASEKPAYGINDIMYFAEIYNADKTFAKRASGHRNEKGYPRFYGEEANYIHKNKKNKFIKYLFELKNPDNKNYFKFDGREILMLSQNCKTKESQALAQTLIETLFKTNYGGPLENLSVEEIIDAVNNSSFEFVSKYANLMEKSKILQILKIKKDIDNSHELYELKFIEDNYGRNYFNKFDHLEDFITEDFKGIILKPRDKEHYRYDAIQIAHFADNEPELAEKIFNKKYLLTFPIIKGYEPVETFLPNSVTMNLLGKAQNHPELVSKLLDYIDNITIMEPNIDKCAERINFLINESIYFARCIPEQKRDNLFAEIDRHKEHHPEDKMNLRDVWNLLEGTAKGLI